MFKIATKFIFLFIFLLTASVNLYSASKNPCAYAHFLNAQLEKTKGNDEKAFQEYEKAIECDPSSFYLRKGLIAMSLGQNKIDLAKDALEKTLKRFPDEADLQLMLAQICKNEGKIWKASKIIERVLRRNPDNQNARYLLLIIFLEDKKWPAAEKQARRIIDFTSSDKPDDLKKVYFLLAMEYAKAENYSEGIKYLKEAQLVSADNPEIHAALGTFYEADGELGEALKEYEKALELSPLALGIYQKLGDVYSRLEEINEAISIYEKALQINNSDYISITNLAQLYYSQGKYNEGLKLLQDCPVKDARVYYLMGTFFLRLKRMDEAQESLEKAVSIFPNSFISYYLLIHIYGEQEKKDKALSLLNNASEKSLLPEDRINFLLGMLHSRFKEYKEAINYLRRARSLNPDDDEISFQLAASYEQNKDWFKAVYHLREAIRINPQNVEALNYLGYMFAEKGVRLNEAGILIKKALKIEPGNGYFIDSLGWVYYQKGLIDKAITELKKAIELLSGDGEDDAIIREHLGDAYYKKGEFLKAKEQWEFSASLDGEREEVKRKLEELKSKLE